MIRTALCAALLLATSSCAHAAIHLDDAQALEVGYKIWKNEANLSVDRLVHWNDGENFASLGIGHFIWYKKGEPGPFIESFPGLLHEFEVKGSTLMPSWLTSSTPCVWRDKVQFDAEFHSARTEELRDLLHNTIAIQARYAADRVEAAMPKILAAAPAADRAALQARFDRVASAPNGVYALMDYVNFKGEGTSLTERYKGQGWGLLQALDGMADVAAGQDSVAAFAAAADAALTRRVANSDPVRNEARWLPGWRKRLLTYLEK